MHFHLRYSGLDCSLYNTNSIHLQSAALVLHCVNIQLHLNSRALHSEYCVLCISQIDLQCPFALCPLQCPGTIPALLLCFIESICTHTQLYIAQSGALVEDCYCTLTTVHCTVCSSQIDLQSPFALCPVHSIVQIQFRSGTSARIKVHPIHSSALHSPSKVHCPTTRSILI